MGRVMVGILFILAVIVAVALVLVASISPNVASISSFEVKRRKDAGDTHVEIDFLRESLFRDVLSIQRVLQAALLVIFVLTSVGAFGWFMGSVIAIVAALWYGSVARLSFVSSFGQKLYGKYELVILAFLQKHAGIVKWVRSVIPASKEVHLTSKDELEYLVHNAHQVLSADEQRLIISSLSFETKLVGDIMTPKSVVDTVSQSELLGPLVLDGLHKTGHSRFPVINGDIDHVVGILHLRDVLTVDGTRKHTSRVDSAMSKNVYYIREDHNLDQALSAFLKTHHHLFVVINEFRETVGIVTLEDTLEALLGRKIIDEFDAHDDMRAVAARQAASRTAINRAPGSKDI